KPVVAAAATAPAAPGNPALAPAPSTAPPPASPPPAAAKAAKETVTVDLRGVPAGTEVLLDGAKAVSLPFEMKRDERRHHHVVRASGHQEKTLEIGADRDQTIDVDLPALAHAKPERHHSSGAAHETAVAAKPAPVPAAKAADANTPAKKVPDNHGRR